MFKHLHQELRSLESRKQDIEMQILKIRKRIEKLSPFSKEEKIALFRSLFIGRDDVYAKYWVSADGAKKGYSPDTYTFRGSDYKPVSDRVIQQHLEGKIRIGSYAVVNQTMTRFLVLDLDKATFVEDARAISTQCQDLGLTPLFEISKSGSGIHIWFFFDGPVRASDARKLGDLLITLAMDAADGIDMGSYDRMFPNQDFVAPDALGNLVALPLHFGSRNENKTVFIDIDTMCPFEDQWDVLRRAFRLSLHRLVSLLKKNLLSGDPESESLMPWEVKPVQPLRFPRKLKAVLFDALYIEKQEIAKPLLHRLQRLASFANPGVLSSAKSAKIHLQYPKDYYIL